MEIVEESKSLQRLKLSGMQLNHPDVIYYISNQFYINPSMIEMDLSHSKIKPSHFNGILSSLREEFESGNGAKFMKFQNLNLSYMSTHGHVEEIANSIAKIVELSPYLMHLDISGLNLKDHIKPIILGLKQNKIMIALHVNDNNLDPKTKDWVMRTLGIEA